MFTERCCYGFELMMLGLGFGGSMVFFSCLAELVYWEVGLRGGWRYSRCSGLFLML